MVAGRLSVEAPHPLPEEFHHVVDHSDHPGHRRAGALHPGPRPGWPPSLSRPDPDDQHTAPAGSPGGGSAVSPGPDRAGTTTNVLWTISPCREERDCVGLGTVTSVGPGGRHASLVCAFRPRHRVRGWPDRGRCSHVDRCADRRRTGVAGAVRDDRPLVVRRSRRCVPPTGRPRVRARSAAATSRGGPGPRPARSATCWTTTHPDSRRPSPQWCPASTGSGAAISFLGVMRWTTYTSSTYSYSEWTGGWTASKDAESGLPIGGFAGVLPPTGRQHRQREHRARHGRRRGQLGSRSVPLASRGRRLHGAGGHAHGDRDAGQQRLVPLERLRELDRDRQRVADHLTRRL